MRTSDRACARWPSPWPSSSRDSRSSTTILEIDVRLPKGSGSTAQQAVAFALVGAFAEPSTHVRQSGPTRDGVDLLVVTGVLPGDSAFATHGHLARVRVLVGG